MNKPMPAESLSDTVRAEIERELLSGALVPGTVLDERSLAERFGVSRTPVREAVLHLAAQGLLNVVPRAGVVVPKLSVQELLSLLEMLAELEGACAKFATRRMDRKERQMLRAAVRACEAAAAARDAKGYGEANTQFHNVIYKGCRNEWAVKQVRALRLRCASYTRSRFDWQGRVTQSLAEHKQVLAAVEAGNPEAARVAMLEHISVGGKDFAEFVSSLNADLLAS
jgi:DNA-binding GntR family transcriptional regulator